MTLEHSDVAIIGAGVIGLSTAWRLARAGASVSVIDPRSADGRASGAAAGMLAPLAEAKEAGPLLDLGLESLRRYPAFVAALTEESGEPLRLSGPGLLRVAVGPQEEKALAAAFAWQQAAAVPLRWLDAEDIRDAEPGLSPEIRAGILSPSEGQLEPPRLLAALSAACRHRGVAFHEERAIGFAARGSRVVAVKTTAGALACAWAVIAAGAWSAALVRPLGVEAPVFPVRGQILCLQCRLRHFEHALYGAGGYLVPRADGRALSGATQERVGFDARTTDAARERLSASARELVPSLAEELRGHLWAGLRPASADGLPILGPLPGWDNVLLATGHFRNGILLAPVTADCLSGLILDGRTELDLAPFGARRFADRACPS